MTEQEHSELTDLERAFPAAPERIWELWTTAEGIESWWSPDGFVTKVHELELEVGGNLVHEMTATAPDQVEFLESAGLPISTVARKTFTEISPVSRIAYRSRVDFVPDCEPYEHLTVVQLTPSEGATRVVMSVEPMHDEIWTERMIAGRTNELENLAAVL